METRFTIRAQCTALCPEKPYTDGPYRCRRQATTIYRDRAYCTTHEKMVRLNDDAREP